jgi:hypothetical protein
MLSIPAVSCVPTAPIYGLRLAVVTPLLLLHLGKLLHKNTKLDQKQRNKKGGVLKAEISKRL